MTERENEKVVEMISVSKEVLTDYGCRVLEALGVPKDEAAWVTECLVNANLKGYYSQGVLRIPWYVKGFQEGNTQVFGNAGVKIKILRETPAVTIVDGCGGFGYTVARQAMELTIEKAKRVGMATTGCRNLGHIGRVGRWSEMALEQDMIGVALQGGGASVAPWGGIESKLPLNPISVAIPTRHGSPFVMDICMAPSGRATFHILAERGEKLPPGWLIDNEGNPTQDPSVYARGEGAQLPLGQEGLGYKGYALAMVLSVLSGPLIGSYDFEIHRPTYGGVFLGAIDIAAFTPIDEFKKSMDDMVADIKSSKLAKGFKEILIPGEGARAREEQMLKSGVPLDDWLWQTLMETAEELGVDTSVYKVEADGARVSLKR